MGNPKPKAMPNESGSTAYKGTCASAYAGAQANKPFISNKPNEEAIIWEAGVKTDRLDILFHFEDTYKGGKAKDALGGFLFEMSLESEVHNGVKIHPLKKGNPGKKGKQDCYSVAVGFSCGKVNLYTAKCDNTLNHKAAFAKLSIIPSEMVRLGKVDALFSDICHCMYHIHNAANPAEPIVAARPSRVDLAYDVAVNLADYCVYAAGIRKTAQVGKNNPSVYLGNNCIFYDKKQQLAEKKGVLILQPHMMRMEVTLPREKVPANFPEGLLDAPNPLLKLRPYLKERACEYLNQNGYSHLTDMIEMTDLNTALKGLYYNKRKALLAALDKVALPDWWKPEKIWNDMVAHTINHPVVAVLKGGKLKGI